MNYEIKNPTKSCEFKFKGNKEGEFSGYASVWNGNDLVNDTIEKGAFSGSIEKQMPKMFFNHDHRFVPVGDWIEAKEDDSGLFVSGKIDMNHRDGPTIYSGLLRKAVDGLSIGFEMNKEDFETKDDGGRIIKRCDLVEVSIVSFPCDESARIADVKSRFAKAETKRDIERLLRDEFGVTKSVACAFLSHAQRVLAGDLSAAEKRINALEATLQKSKAVQSIYEKLKSFEV